MASETLIDEALRNELSALYRAADRHYHGMAHIDAMLGLLEAHRGEFADAEAVEAAIWFHDAVYDSRRSDNEVLSAKLAAEKLRSCVGPERLARIVAMIEATATHTIPELTEVTARNDAALFLDIDLSILGAPPAAFDTYEAAVRREYGWVDEAAWRSGRAAVLKKFSGRPEIFYTATFRNLLEARARDNISRSIAALGGA